MAVLCCQDRTWQGNGSLMVKERGLWNGTAQILVPNLPTSGKSSKPSVPLFSHL